MLKITIPTPCHENWNKMTPDQTGRHCSVCAKSVVDFTNMSDEAVKNFFLNKKADERVCGRFKQTQLHRIVIEMPHNIFSMRMPLWKKFLAACLVVFSTSLFSCETKIKAVPQTNVHTTELSKTATDDHGMVGGISYSITPDSVEVAEVCSETVGISIIEPIQVDTTTVLNGDVDIVEVDSALSIPVDTIPVLPQKKDIIITGDSIYTELPAKKAKPGSFTKTKNPPEADSVNCNTIKNYN